MNAVLVATFFKGLWWVLGIVVLAIVYHTLPENWKETVSSVLVRMFLVAFALFVITLAAFVIGLFICQGACSLG